MMKRKTPRGLVCLSCGHTQFMTIYTSKRNEKIQRRKRCKNCGRDVITVEKILRNLA